MSQRSNKRPRQDVGAAVLEAACRLLETEGPEALTTRRIAAEAGTTTMTLYSHFGDKDGVEQALVVEGFTRLKAGLERAAKRSTDSEGAVLAVARAYRRFANENPAFFAAMFQRSACLVDVNAESHRLGNETFAVLARATQRALGAAASERDAEVVARRIWAMCHGTVALEMVGMGVPAPASGVAFDDAIRAVLRGST